MRFVDRNFRGPILTAILGACWIATATAGCVEAQAVQAQTDAQNQEAASTTQAGTGYITLEHRTPSQLDSADAGVVRAKKREIATEAAFFGYNLNLGGWMWNQTVCPQIPDDMILHYRKQAKDGAESLFTAVVPRGAGRVYVVPVLYRSATPFRSAVGSERSITVFNQAVPADVADKAAQPEGHWLSLGMCYAEIVSAEPNVPERSNSEIGLINAPLPTFRVSDTGSEIIFTDRDAPNQYTVWSVIITAKGRVTAATAKKLSDYLASKVNPENPPEKVVPAGEEPKTVPAPPTPEPKQVPAPPAAEPQTNPQPHSTR